MLRVLRQNEDSEHAAELGEVLQLFVSAHGTETVGVLLETRGNSDSGPSAVAREHADVLLAFVLPGVQVAVDTGGRLDLVVLLPNVVRVDALHVPLECAA